MQQEITIYGPEFSTYVRTVRLCCEEKEISYCLQEELSQMPANPFKRVPVIEHNGFVLYETAAICRYLDRVFIGTNLQPDDIKQRALMDQWVSAANAYFDPAIVRNYLLVYAFPETDDGKPDMQKIQAALPRVREVLQIMNQTLAQNRHFSGEQPGIADYLILPMIDYLRMSDPDEVLSEVPEVRSYLARMRQRSSVQKILQSPRMLSQTTETGAEERIPAN